MIHWGKLFFFLTVTLLISCQLKNPNTATPSEKKITFALPAMPDSLEEAENFPEIFELIHEGLTRFHFVDGKLQVKPAMAHSWIFVNPLQLQMKIKDYRGLDGRFFTASEIANYLNEKLSEPDFVPCRKWRRKRIKNPVATILPLDDRTLDFHFSEPAPNFLHVLACPELWPSRRSAQKKLVLAGPFHVISHDSHEWQLTPSPFYHEPLDPNLHLQIRKVEDPITRVELVEHREIDFATDATPDFMPVSCVFQKRHGLRNLFLVLHSTRPELAKYLLSTLSADLWQATRGVERFIGLAPPWVARVPVDLTPLNFTVSFEPSVAEMGRRIIAEWQTMGISVQFESKNSHADISIREAPLDPIAPYDWPIFFPTVQSVKPLVLAPSLDWLQENFDRSLMTVVKQGSVWPLGTRYHQSVSQPNFSGEASFYGGLTLNAKPGFESSGFDLAPGS